jgi:thiamine-monophosphate kinase
VGYRAAAAALSDLAAMGARPIGVLVALSFPDAWHAHIGQVGDGIGEAAALAGAPIVGGNITGGGHLAITITVLGESPHPLRRDGAREGDIIYVTGRLGGPGRALASWLAGREPDAVARARFARPVARTREGQWLAAHGARAAIDVSDGLAADLRHLAAASHVRLVVDLATVPCMPGVTPREAVASGEEYELVVTAGAPLDGQAFEDAFAVPLTAIGRVERVTDAGASVTAAEGGAFVDLPRGHDHLSS